MFDPPWWFFLVLIAINLPWFAGVALLGACLPRPGARWWWRLAGFVAGGVLAAVAVWLSWIVWDVVGGGMAAARTLERTVWAVNAAAAAVAAALVVQRRRR